MCLYAPELFNKDVNVISAPNDIQIIRFITVDKNCSFAYNLIRRY